MFKHHKYIALVIGLLYVVVLQEFSVPQPVFRFLLPVFAVYLFAVGYYNARFLRWREKYNFWIALRPLLLFLSGFGILLLLPSATLRGFFLITAFFVISVVELTLGNFAENLLLNETLIIAFGFFVALTGFGQYFPRVGNLTIWPLLSLKLNFSLQPVYLALVFAASALLSRAFYQFIPQSSATKLVAAIILGLFCSELYWAISFLPLHYSAQAVILLSLFYFCLILNYYYLFHTLTIKKIQFHLILILLACGVVVLATPWRIIQ